MKVARSVLGFLAATFVARGADEFFFDRLADRLTVSSADTQVRAHLSGTVELEAYSFQTPPPGLLVSDHDTLLAPRLTLFLDAQAGRTLYAFAQMRADRGFDPREARGEVRLDEVALRYTPWRDGRFNLQVGRFATVVGNWTTRHAGWTNPFITAPLPYELLTGMWDTEAVRGRNQLLQWSHLRPGLSPAVEAVEKDLRIPIIWGPSYASGVAVSGDLGRWRYAAEAKLGSLSSRPEAWQHGYEQRHHPTVSVRLGYRPNPAWDVGVSASSGTYLREGAEHTLAGRHGRGDYRERVIAQDTTFAWHHWQLWSEIYAARFEIPNVGDADTVAYYIEAKYKFTPQMFGALRWNQQLFGTLTQGGIATKWGQDVWRVDVGPGFRFTPHTQLKFQYSLQHGDSGTRVHTRLLSLQFTLRF